MLRGSTHIIPIRGKPRTLERTIVDSRFVDGGREGRAMDVLTNFWGFYSRGLECAQRGDPGAWSDHTIYSRSNAVIDGERVPTVHTVAVRYIYRRNFCAFLFLSLITRFFIPAMHLFTALGLSSGSTGSTSTEGSTGRERGVIGTELSSSVVDTSVVNPGVFWRGCANVLRGKRPGNGVGGVENK